MVIVCCRIKKAYRKKALELHPDRNFGDTAKATEQFAEVQTAYEILSDPQERAWYDSHKDVILGGDDPTSHTTTFRDVRLTSADEIRTLVSRFNSTVQFTDEPSGFYGILKSTFDHLALEEQAAADAESDYIPEYATFGTARDSYEETVTNFYKSWASFSTKKKFSWKDKYRLSDAPDRRTRRFMEKENQKVRDEAVLEFNQTVRFLVSFVRKRDPRYTPNHQSQADKEAASRSAAAAQAARSRAANQRYMADFAVPDWVHLDEEESRTEFSESDTDSVVHLLECVVCDKTFKSDKQLEAHERSKKHVKALAELRRQMIREGINLDLDESNTPSATTTPISSSGDDVGKHVDESIPLEHNISDISACLDSLELEGGDTEAMPDSSLENFTVGVDGEIATATDGQPDSHISDTRKIGKAKAKREKKAAKLQQAGVLTHSYHGQFDG